MRLNKANFAGLTSPGQQAEMKSILAGRWPPLRPLPVFKYETGEYRATISFDKKRGEWVCRKTSLPSNEVQELRGGLREITLALPHGETEIFSEGEEQQEPEFERETSRRLQATRDWSEKYKNGARYFELRGYLSESQRTELDDSLRLSLTARQLQFNPKNLADIFDDLSVAGGRFAALIEFAKGNQANQGVAAQEQVDASVTEAEHALDEEKNSLEITSPEFGGDFKAVLNTTDALVPNEAATDRCSGAYGAEGFPVLSIKDVFPEKDQPSLPERMAHSALQQVDTDTYEVVDADSASLVELPDQEAHHSPAFAGYAAKVPIGQTFPHGIEGSSSRFLPLKMSAFQVNVFAIMLLFAVTSFTVGLTVGRGPLGKRLREPPKLILPNDAPLPAPVDQPADEADESTPRTPTPLVASSDGSARSHRPDDAAPSEEKSKESFADADSAEARSTDSDSSPATESVLAVKPEANSERSGEIGMIARTVSPLPSSKPLHSRKAFGAISSEPRRSGPYRLSSPAGAAPHLPRPSTALVTVPSGASQPIRVNFPTKTIAATSSLAMSSQLSVLVSPEPAPAMAHKPVRLEAGELVSFGWPHYARPVGRYGFAETIRVRATIGEVGQVQEVKFLSGTVSLLPATTAAIRQWRYKPTLLDKRPVQAQQDITIEFRPPQYSSQVSTRQPSRN